MQKCALPPTAEMIMVTNQNDLRHAEHVSFIDDGIRIKRILKRVVPLA
jgi:hypothetical protein